MAGGVQAAQCALQVLRFCKPGAEVFSAKLAAEEVFDEVLFGRCGEDLGYGLAGEGCGDALAGEVAQDALAAEDLVVFAGCSVGLGIAGVVEGAVFSEAGQQGCGIGGIEGAGKKFLAEIACRDGTRCEQRGGIGFKGGGIEAFGGFAERHDWSLACTLKAERAIKEEH